MINTIKKTFLLLSWIVLMTPFEGYAPLTTSVQRKNRFLRTPVQEHANQKLSKCDPDSPLKTAKWNESKKVVENPDCIELIVSEYDKAIDYSIGRNQYRGNAMVDELNKDIIRVKGIKGKTRQEIEKSLQKIENERPQYASSSKINETIEKIENAVQDLKYQQKTIETKNPNEADEIEKTIEMYEDLLKRVKTISKKYFGSEEN
ncbi:hypothetical protein [Holospora undulata]|uniref:Uncharacterized protein n=1 Tax=Holospora undulata HU1 TaxID=1321371 RepID=A0A061JIF4_9PROT|nr:hypothetical protein [Holospora undulata]ETZ05338.1 hypothetical protein K737_300218 [Holospora undulata HU1]